MIFTVTGDPENVRIYYVSCRFSNDQQLLLAVNLGMNRGMKDATFRLAIVLRFTYCS